jgi:hypothetical protein
MPEKQPIQIRDLYPDFTDEQLAEAESKLRRFVHLLAKIYEERNALQDLTARQSSPTIPSERSKPQ